MKLSEFIEEKRAELTSFKKGWTRKHESAPMDYLLEMEIEEWEHEFILWRECFPYCGYLKVEDED
jgi:hypothetical protein